MDAKKLASRNSALDIVRIVAVFTVVSVHFLLYNGFYNQTVEGAPMYIMVLMRTLFSVCVPMFMVLTGYLMSKKELSGSYYKGIRKTLIIFVIATIACMLFKTFYLHEEFNLLKLLTDTLNFKGATYSWYIEMYIGLFLIAPFLNLAYNGLKSQRQKQILVLTFVAVTVLPTLFNVHVFNPMSWWSDPKSSDDFFKLVPGWWAGLYPLAYYFTGAYLREYGLKAKTRTILITFVIAVFLFGSFNFYRSYGTTFKTGTYVNWGGFEPYLLTVMLFTLLSRIKTDKMKTGTKKFLMHFADLALGTYLLSYMFDRWIYYDILNKNVAVMTDRLPFYFLCVPIIFILASLASLLANLLAGYVIEVYETLVKFIKRQRLKDDKEKWRDIIFAVLLGSGIVFAIWKCFYGFGGDDEAFYLTIPQRLLQGDKLFVDEWHLSQMSSVLLLPFVGIYRMFAGSYEGIILAARIYYVFVHAGVCAVVYTRLRKYGYITMFGVLFFFIFTPYDIMAYSYNTMALDLLVLAGTLLATANYSHKAAIIISGVCFAGAVLCSPYLALGYVLYAIGMGVHYALKKKETKLLFKSEMFGIKTFLWFTVGVAGLAAIFLGFVMSRESLGDVFSALPKILSDPEHPQIPFMTRLGHYFNSIYEFHPQFKLGLFAYLATLLVMIFDKKRRTHRTLYLIITIGVVIFCYVLIMPTLLTRYYNALMFPMIFVGITSYILCEKKPKELFFSTFMLGILYSFAICFSSNQYFYVVAMAISVANVASIVFLSVLMKEIRETEDSFDYAKMLKYASISLVALMMFAQGYLQLTVKANHCFWETPNMSLLSTEIKSGPAKGISTTEANVQSYDTLYTDIQELKKLEKGSVLFVSGKTWSYLAMDSGNSSYSAWIGDENILTIDNVLSRLDSYYQSNPQKLPKYIFMPQSAKWDTQKVLSHFITSGYVPKQLGSGYLMHK